MRAAYWTATVLDCIFERSDDGGSCTTPSPRATVRRSLLYAASGASGGSLGIAEWLTYLHAFPTGPAQPDWPRDALGEDFLAPTLATMLLGDGPNLLLRDPNRSGDEDRAATLERAWERAWATVPGAGTTSLGDPFLAGQRAGTSAASPGDGVVEPLALLNSTNDANGCRVEVSVIDGAVADGRPPSNGCVGVRRDSPLGGTVDLTDGFVCRPDTSTDGPSVVVGDNDVRRSTAAMMSARFPFVTPSGWLTSCDGKDRVFTVDGGYLDTSAASAPTELWPRISEALCPQGPADCAFEPVFVQIDNDPTDAAQHLVDGPAAADRKAPAPPNELLVPFKGLNSSQGGQADSARAAACLQFSQQGRWVHLAVSPSPGAAPPLGWVLSPETQSTLRAELQTEGNADALHDLHDWLDHGVPAVGDTSTSGPPSSC